MRKIVLFFLIAIFVSGPALAQSKKELAAQNAALAERLSRLESRMLTGDPAAEQLMQRMDALEAEQRSLTGEIEQLRFERNNLKAEITALNEDISSLEALEDRMRLHLDAVDLVSSERSRQQSVTVQPQSTTVYDGSPVTDSYGAITGIVDPNQPSNVPSAPVSRDVEIPVGSYPGGSAPAQAYPNLDNLPEQGKQKLYEGNFTGAQSDFKTYLAISPDAANSGEVSYWLGETYFVKGGYADAADAYITSMRKDPQGVKAPEALIRLAASMRELGKKTESCQALDSFPVQFPGASAELREKVRTEQARTGC